MTEAAGALSFDVSRLPQLYQPDTARIDLARRRQAAVWRGETPDRWPLLLNGPLAPGQQAIPAPNFKEAFYDADLMLCSGVRAACGAAAGASDAVPSMRANMGTGTLPACLGLEQRVFEDKMPWLRERLTRAQAAKLQPDDIRVRGAFERGLDAMRRVREIMGDALPVYCMDTQGPLDLAHLLIGDDLFYALIDDPPFVHHLMEICLELGIRGHAWMKEVAGEPRDRHYHGNALYAENMGVRICEDTTVMLGPDAVAEFAVPYTRRLAQHFGGAWIHYCGRRDHLTEMMLDIPEVRGINFGHLPRNKDAHVLEEDMRRVLARGKVYFGGWPRDPGESGRDYLRRMHRWAAEGCMILNGGAAIGGDHGFDGPADALDFWYGL